MEILPYHTNCGQVNMDIDSELLESAIKKRKKEPIFRLYGWNPPCVSLGRNQNDSFFKSGIFTK